MPDQTPTQPQNNQPSFWKEYLPDIKNWLLGAGGAALGAKGLGTGVSKGVFLALPQFEKLGGARSLHPAVARELGYHGNLFQPEAVNMQRQIDQHVVNNYPHYSSLPSSQWDKLHRQTGWGFGPQTGFGREVPDLGMNVVGIDNPKSSIRNAKVIHPGGDVHSALNMRPVEYFHDPEGDLGSAFYNLKFRNIRLNDQLLGSKPDWYPSNLGPWNKNTVAGHELQHAAQHQAGVLDNIDNSLRHNESPWEWEANASEFSQANPAGYQMPFAERATPTNYYFSNFLNALKGQ